MLVLAVDNNTLAPLLEYKTKPTSTKRFWKLLSCLTFAFANKSWNDHIFGAAHYLANMLCILIQEMTHFHIWQTHVNHEITPHINHKELLKLRLLKYHQINQLSKTEPGHFNDLMLLKRSFQNFNKFEDQDSRHYSADSCCEYKTDNEPNKSDTQSLNVRHLEEHSSLSNPNIDHTKVIYSYKESLYREVRNRWRNHVW